MTNIDNAHAISWNDRDQPYSERFGDHFYSSSDGRAETQHVFLAGNDLPRHWMQAPRFTIAELGFGTGLNFFETWRAWRETRRPGQHLSFVSFEAFPLNCEEISRAISAWPDLVPLTEPLLGRWEELSETPGEWIMDDQTSLTLVKSDARSGVRKWRGTADAWYLDGFSPSTNPDMWSAGLMREVFEHTGPAGTLATYSAAGWVRRNLEEAGFSVTKKPGFASKRHMISGIKRVHQAKQI